MPGSSMVGGHGTPGSRQLYAASSGETVTAKLERGDRYSAPEVYTVELTILQILRGGDAREHIEKTSLMYPARPGFIPFLVRLRLGYFSKGRGLERLVDPYVVGQELFAAVSSDGKTEYPLPQLAEQPQPQLIDVPFSPGDTKEGWIALEIPATEQEPFLIFKRDLKEFTYGVWGPLWFRLSVET